MPTRAPLIRSHPNQWGLLAGLFATLLTSPPAMAWGIDGSVVAVGHAPGPASDGMQALASGRGPGSTDLYTPGVHDPELGLVGPWERGFEARRTLLERSRGEVAAIAGLLGLVDELYGEIERARLVKLLTGVSEDRRHDPLVRAEARRSLARLHALAGEPALASALMESSGWMLNWELVGPFDNAGKMGHDEVYAPETTAYDAAQAFTGKLPDEPLRWQHRKAAGSGNGYISFDEAVAPNIHVTGYASAWIKVPRRTSAALHLGTGGAYKVWIDGNLVGEGEAYRQPHAIQDGHGVTLSPGWHRVLVKLGVEEGLWGFFLRVSDAKGAPIRGLVSWSGPGAPDGAATPAPSSGSASAQRPGTTARSVLEAAVQGTRAGAAEYEALAALYRWHRPFAPESSAPTAFAREMDSRLGSPRSAWSASFLVQDFNEARAFVASGIDRAREARDGDRALLGTMLAELARRDSYLGLERRAKEGYAQASETSPDDVYIELSRLNELSGDGFTLGSIAWLDDMVSRYPRSLFLRRAAADLQAEIGRPREALARYREMLEEHPGNESLRETVIGLLMSLGDVQEAVKQARARAAAGSSSARNWVSLARLEVALGRPDDAMRSMQRAIDIKPLNSEYHRLAGVILTDHGRVKEGLIALRRSLELRPQQPGVQDLIAVLDPRDEAGMLERYDVPLEKIVAAASPRAAWEGKEAAVLHDVEVVRMLDNGLSERLEHRVVRILDERGTRSQSVQVTGYDPSESYVEVRRARVRRADGLVEELGETDVVSMVESGYRMYYDKRQVQVSFPGLRVGDVVEVVFAHRPVARRNIFDDYFGDVAILGGNQPIDHKVYVLEAPADRPLFFNVPVNRTLSEDGNLAIYRIERSNLEGVKSEGSMPGWSEIFEFVHVSTFESWEDVGNWYWDLVKGQLVVNDEIRGGVEEALASLPRGATRRDKVGAIYRQVVRSTRYVGLEFGIHGYKPYRTTEVFDRRFGDCKDKASLLKVMLAEAGIDSHLVLVRTRDQGKLKQRPASLAAFNHAIVYVPEFDLFLDGTAEWSGDSELPANDQGASVLVVEDGAGARFTTIPISGAGDNVYAVEETVSLQQDGQATLRQQLTVTGTQAPGRRSMYEAPDKRLELLARNLGASFPGAEVEDATFDSVEDILKPVEMNYTFRAPEWATSTDGGLRFDLLGGREGMVRRIAPQVSRTHPLVLGVPFRLQRRGTVRAPEGQVFVAAPSDATLRSDFGSMRLRASVAETEASYELVMEFSAIQIPPERYEEFRAFLAEIDSRLRMAFETGAAQ